MREFEATFKAEVNAENNSSVRPLQLAVRIDESWALERLFKSKVLEIDDEDNDGNTAAQQAAISGHVACLDALLYRKADADHSNKHGSTSHKDCMMPLLKPFQIVGIKVADPTKTDKCGKTVLFCACRGESAEPALLLLEYLQEKGSRSPKPTNLQSANELLCDKPRPTNSTKSL